MTDEISFTNSPDPEDVDTGLEGNTEQDFKKARDKSLPISERGAAFTRIYKVASYSKEKDINTREAALEHVIQLFPELGTEESANFLATLLDDPSPEICAMALANVSTFVEKTDHTSFEAVIYKVVEELGANQRPSNEEPNALEDVAKHLMRSYSTQFFSALVVPSSVSKGSLRWLATNYPKFRSEIFSDGSEAGARADRALMTALKSASAQLTDTIDEAMLAMDAMNTVSRSVQSMLDIYSDLLRVSGEPGIVIVSTALTSSMMNQGTRGTQRDRPRTPKTVDLEYPKHPSRGSDSNSQISPKTNIRRFSSEIGMRGAASGRYRYTEGISTHGDVVARPYTPTSQVTPSTPAPTQQCHRSSSAPPTPTPSKRTFREPEARVDDEPKRARRERNGSKTPSPTHGSQRHGNSPGQGGSEAHRGNGARGGYQGRNFIAGYIPSHRGRAGYRGREVYRPSYHWRGRQTQWGGRGERSEHHSSYRGTDYPPRAGYE